MLPYPHGAGAYAEYAKGTAYQALVDTADIQPGQRVLIHAAAGGVGHLAVQIAKAYGAHVIGTASAGKHELLRELATQGRRRAHIDATFPLADAAKAHAHGETDRTTGKIVLIVR